MRHRLRRLVEALPADPARIAWDRSPGRAPTDLYDLFHAQPRQEYDIRNLLPCILDNAPFDEYKAEYGQSLVCGYGRLGGVAVGVVANQHQRSRPARGPLQYGGVLYVDSAEKAEDRTGIGWASRGKPSKKRLRSSCSSV